MTEQTTLRGKPVVYGEVLFDQFEDGSVVLGGAPFNVAWHLQGFGLQPIFISRVGKDDLGERVLRAMTGWGMDTRGLQKDPLRSTGTVQVALQNGQPAFNILPDQAYDYIDAGPLLPLLTSETCSLLYYGSLISRSATSRESLQALRTNTRLPAFVDINLRSPWWDHPLIWQSLRGARWAKLNDQEIKLAIEEKQLAQRSIEEAATALRQKYQFELLIATLGEKGAYFVDEKGVYQAQPVKVETLVDTVGAGDAFSAVTILGLIHGWPHPLIQQRAMEFASTICQIRGATTAQHELYTACLERWKEY